MIGFHATAASTDIRLMHDDELEDGGAGGIDYDIDADCEADNRNAASDGPLDGRSPSKIHATDGYTPGIFVTVGSAEPKDISMQSEELVESSDILLREMSDGGILRLTLDDQRRRNALSDDMLARLRQALDQAASDASVRVIVLAATGPAFCAGHDLKEMTRARQAQDGGRAFFAETMASCAGVMQAIVDNPKPVIAEVDGIATAAGCQLVASCDLAYASPAARLATPGVNIGLFCSTPMVALSRNVENKFAMEMLLTGDLIAAEQAAADRTGQPGRARGRA